MKKYLDTSGVLDYPDIIKRQRFCCWRYEKQNGRYTKVPYNAKTGCKAKTDTPETFCSMEAALKALETGKYSGIGFNIDKDSDIYALIWTIA